MSSWRQDDISLGGDDVSARKQGVAESSQRSVVLRGVGFVEAVERQAFTTGLDATQSDSEFVLDNTATGVKASGRILSKGQVGVLSESDEVKSLDAIILECPHCQFASHHLLTFHCVGCDCRGCQKCLRRSTSGDWVCAQCRRFLYLGSHVEIDARDSLQSSNVEVQAPDSAFIGAVSCPDLVDDHVKAGTSTDFWVQGRPCLIPTADADEKASNKEEEDEKASSEEEDDNNNNEAPDEDQDEAEDTEDASDEDRNEADDTEGASDDD